MKPLSLTITTVLFCTITSTTADAMYNPRLGRFLQRDPVGLSNSPAAAPRLIPTKQYVDGLNVYSYAVSNPLHGMDPSGLQVYGGAAHPTACCGDLYCPPPPDCLKECPKICSENQGRFKEDDAGKVFCKSGCECACVNEKHYPPTDNTPGGKAARMCAFKHEEEHVKGPGVCGLFDGIKGPWPWNDYPDLECKAAAAQVECLNGAKSSCGGDTTCLGRIDWEIDNAWENCREAGGNPKNYQQPTE